MSNILAWNTGSTASTLTPYQIKNKIINLQETNYFGVFIKTKQPPPKKKTYRSWLGHCKHINNPHGIVINKFSQHQTHNFHWYTSTPMLQHLVKSKYKMNKKHKIQKINFQNQVMWPQQLPWAGPKRRCTLAQLCPQQVHLLGGPAKQNIHLQTLPH